MSSRIDISKWIPCGVRIGIQVLRIVEVAFPRICLREDPDAREVATVL